jgi:hypothetical protein
VVLRSRSLSEGENIRKGVEYRILVEEDSLLYEVRDRFVPPEVEFSLRRVRLNFLRLVTAIIEQPHQLGAMALSS